jgi:hypothetical protein
MWLYVLTLEVEAEVDFRPTDQVKDQAKISRGFLQENHPSWKIAGAEGEVGKIL